MLFRSSILLNYVILKNHLEDPGERVIDTSKPLKKKKLKPKFITEVIEEIVKNYDLPDVEIRKVLIEEITKAQLMQEEEAERRRLVEEKEREMLEKQRAEEKEQQRLAKEAEKERIRKEKEELKERIRLEKEREAQVLRDMSYKVMSSSSPKINFIPKSFNFSISILTSSFKTSNFFLS